MDKDLLAALGLPETADLATAINAATQLKVPALDRYVPRADYDAALSRASNAEQALKTRDDAEKDRAAQALVDAAIAEGKIAPASKGHFLALAKNSVEDVKAFLASAPVVLAPGADKDLAKGDPAKGDGALSEAQKALCAQMGLTEEQYRKAMA